jgi:hypothetical protein
MKTGATEKKSTDCYEEGRAVAFLGLFPNDKAAEELAHKKGPDQNGEGYQPPAEPRKDAQSDHPRDGRMYGKEPRWREFLRPCPPEAERKIQEKHGQRHKPDSIQR